MYIINALVVSGEDTVIASHMHTFRSELMNDDMDKAVEKLYEMYTDINPLYKIGGLKRFIKKNIINFQVFEIVNADSFTNIGGLSEILSSYGVDIKSYNDLYDPKILEGLSFDERKRICERAVSYRFYLYDANHELIECYDVIGDSEVSMPSAKGIAEDFKPKYVSGQRINGYRGPGVVVNKPEDAIPYSYIAWNPGYHYQPDEYIGTNMTCELD